jgi:tRNA pseudouridine65 synthase
MTGQAVTVSGGRSPTTTPPGRAAFAEGLPVLFLDGHLVAVHKPAGLLVHRTDLDRHARRFALQLVRDQLGQRVYPVHRLDRGASGVLLLALSAGVAQALSGQFERGEVRKTYLAVVRGHPPEAGEVDSPLARRPEDRGQAAGALTSGPLPAVTRFRRLATVELPHRVDRYPTSRYALLAVEPATGRRHQVRRHLKHIAHPIVGDATYGKGGHNRLFTALFGSSRLLLACVEVGLAHPATGERLTITAPLAEDFAAVVRALGWAPCVPARWLPGGPGEQPGQPHLP